MPSFAAHSDWHEVPVLSPRVSITRWQPTARLEFQIYPGSGAGECQVRATWPVTWISSENHDAKQKVLQVLVVLPPSSPWLVHPKNCEYCQQPPLVNTKASTLYDMQVFETYILRGFVGDVAFFFLSFVFLLVIY